MKDLLERRIGRNSDRIRADRRRGFLLAIIAVVSNLGTKLKSSFSSISTQLK